MKRLSKWILMALPGLVLLVLWEYVLVRTDRSIFLFSTPSRIAQSLLENVRSGLLLLDFWTTGSEALLGFLLGNVVGSCLGILLAVWRNVSRLAKPYVLALGAIPIFALAPMMIIWFGTGLFAKVMMAGLSTVFVAMTQAYDGATQVDIRQINLLKSFGANRSQIFSRLLLPSSLIWVFSSWKVNIGLALLGAFVAEYISSNQGLGYRILKAGGTYDVALVWASLSMMVLLALVFSGLIRLLERVVIKWR